MPDKHSTITSIQPYRCVVLVSGGVDSAACIDFYQKQGFGVSGLHECNAGMVTQEQEWGQIFILDFEVSF